MAKVELTITHKKVNKIMPKTVCIYCGANTGNHPTILKAVHELVDLLIQNQFDLVYGGGKTGLMGIVANQFLVANRQVIGVRPNKLIADEDVHNDLSKLIVVSDMHERKSKMIELSDAFIALPGGVGTLDEIIDVYTQVKIGFTDKFCGILNVDNYYWGLETLLANMVEKGFLKEADRQLLYLTDSPERLIARLLRAC